MRQRTLPRRLEAHQKTTAMTSRLGKLRYVLTVSLDWRLPLKTPVCDISATSIIAKIRLRIQSRSLASLRPRLMLCFHAFLNFCVNGCGDGARVLKAPFRHCVRFLPSPPRLARARRERRNNQSCRPPPYCSHPSPGRAGFSAIVMAARPRSGPVPRSLVDHPRQKSRAHGQL